MDIGIEDEEEYRLPSSEALLAGTLAMMTGHAQACGDNTRQAMNLKIVGGLSQLAEHPGFSPLFRAALWSLLRHWEMLQREPRGSWTSSVSLCSRARSASFARS